MQGWMEKTAKGSVENNHKDVHQLSQVKNQEITVESSMDKQVRQDYICDKFLFHAVLLFLY